MYKTDENSLFSNYICIPAMKGILTYIYIDNKSGENWYRGPKSADLGDSVSTYLLGLTWIWDNLDFQSYNFIGFTRKVRSCRILKFKIKSSFYSTVFCRPLKVEKSISFWIWLRQQLCLTNVYSQYLISWLIIFILILGDRHSNSLLNDKKPITDDTVKTEVNSDHLTDNSTAENDEESGAYKIAAVPKSFHGMRVGNSTVG